MLVLPFDRKPVLERDVRPEYVEDVGLADAGDVDVIVRIIVRSERTSRRMLTMVLLSEANYGGIIVDHRRISGRQIAPENAFATQQCFRKGAIHLADEDLVIAAASAGQDQW